MSDLDQEVVRIAWKGTEITAKIIQALMKEAIERKSYPVHGEQSIQQLNEQNKQLENVDITKKDLKILRSQLKRHGVDFSILKDPATKEFSVYFKSQDVSRVYKGLEKCISEIAKEKKPMKEVIEKAEKEAEKRSAERSPAEKTKTASREQTL